MIPQKTACFLVIGNEILSGRTQEANICVLVHALNQQGICLDEVRIIPDQQERIVNTVTECRARFNYVFTSGGIGPTHDDITSACVAEAFGVPLLKHEPSFRQLEALFPPGRFNEARQRMAYLPEGATPIHNAICNAPGFSLGNVHVMAGVPRIFAAMVSWLVPQLASAPPLTMKSWYAFDLPEGELAAPLRTLQETFATLDLGSYPFETNEKHGVVLVAKGYNAAKVQTASVKIKALITSLGFTPLEGEPIA